MIYYINTMYMIKKIKKPIFYIILLIVIIQIMITYFYTNGKEFSSRAFIRNLVIGLTIYFYIIHKNLLYFFIPVLFEIVLELLKLKGLHFDKYIATKYQYNDYWRNINKKNKIFSNFSEGNYNNILGFDTTDHSQKNLYSILKWSKKIYDKSLKNKSHYIEDITGKKHYGKQLKNITDKNKFKLISNICGIKRNMRILEIGFGEGDFLCYIRDNFNINPVGVSIAQEQVDLIKSKGIEGYCYNSWDMTKEKLGTFDLIIQCGNFEYIKCSGEGEKKNKEFCKIIYSLLNPNGKYFITCIHFNTKFTYTLYDYINAYFLWSGNDGAYPDDEDGITKYAEKVGFKTIYQQERTNDYFITSAIFMSYLQCMSGKCETSISLKGICDALIKTIAAPYYIHTYLCYSPQKNFYWLPWLWEFIPQKKNGKWISPVTLQYILMQK